QGERAPLLQRPPRQEAASFGLLRLVRRPACDDVRLTPDRAARNATGPDQQAATRSPAWRTLSARPPCRLATRPRRAPRTCEGASRGRERRRSIVAPSTGTGRT